MTTDNADTLPTARELAQFLDISVRHLRNVRTEKVTLSASGAMEVPLPPHVVVRAASRWRALEVSL